MSIALGDAPLDEAIATDALGNSFTLRRRKCPICAVDASTVLGLRGGAHHRYRQGIESRIVRCHRCGLLYPDPFPYPCDSQKLYGDPDHYFGETDPSTKIDLGRALVKEMAERLGVRGLSLLDVGCGRGELLAAARREGIRALGLEPSEAMATYARDSLKVDVLVTTVEEFLESTDQLFDVVTLCGVLEHVHDPDSAIACVKRLLRPGGIVYIDVPREPNLLTMVGNAWNAVRGNPTVYNLHPTWPPYHVFGFNPRAIGVLLSKYDFVIESLRVHADSHVPSRDDWKDRARAFVASQIHRVGNHTHLGANMYVWARRP